MHYRMLAKMSLHNIELRHMFTEETEYTRRLDQMDWDSYLYFLELAEREEQKERQKVQISVDESSRKEAKKKIDELYESFPWIR